MNSHYPMDSIYKLAGFTRQAHWKYMSRRRVMLEKSEALIQAVKFLRRDHPRIGGKKLYRILMPEHIGRDLFFELLAEHDLLIEPQKSSTRTTFSTRSHHFPNLLPGLVINNINQLWTTDITYFRIGEMFYYISFIVDVYSRRILAAMVSDDLRASSSVNALKAALKERGRKSYYYLLIHHSDQGVQYASYDYTELLELSKIKISMSSVVYENSHVERVNCTIKNEYLINWKITMKKELVRALEKAVDHYNNTRPHWSLELLTPVQYENKIANLKLEDRPQMALYSEKQQYDAMKEKGQLSLFGKS